MNQRHRMARKRASVHRFRWESIYVRTGRLMNRRFSRGQLWTPNQDAVIDAAIASDINAAANLRLLTGEVRG